MPEVTIKLKELHEAQKEVYRSKARYIVLACGRRFGKTALAIDKMVNAILDHPKPYFYIVPTHSDMLTVWDEFMEVTRPLIIKSSVGERRIKYMTGATLWFFSSEGVDRIRGKAFAGGIIDEAAKMPNLEYAWDRAISPTLLDHKGWVWFISSFSGRNYFWQLYQRGQDSLIPEFESFSFPTIANPYIDPAEIEFHRRTKSQKAFEEEYLAIPNEDYGAVFRKVQDCIRQMEHVYNEPVVMGVDWGRYHDFTVLVIMGRKTKQVYEIDRFNDIGWELQRGRLMALYNRWKPKIIVAESNSIGEPNIEALQRQGLPMRPFLTTNASKANIIDDLALSIENREIGFDENKPHVKDLINELQAYEMERLPSGNLRYNAAAGAFDDCVIACALALSASLSGYAAYAEMPEELLDWRG